MSTEVVLTYQAVAECYGVERTWVVRVVEAGLVVTQRTDGGGERGIPVSMLDRVAEVRRLERTLGLDIEVIALWLPASG